MRALSRFASLAVAFVFAFAVSSKASAQVAPTFRFAVGAGASSPIGSSGDDLNTGWMVYGAGELGVPASPLGVRAELTYAKFGAKGLSGTGVSGDGTDLGVNLNGVMWMTPSSAVTPGFYLAAGPSFSRLEASVRSGSSTFSDTENHWGFNIGGGVDIPVGTLAVRIDARYKQISTDDESFKSIPITVGIRF